MSLEKKPYLLLTNDDGINAPGLQALANALEPEFDLLIVAPHRERSATGHAISVLKDLKLEKIFRKSPSTAALSDSPSPSSESGNQDSSPTFVLRTPHSEGVHWGWSFQGKPADCVKVAVTVISKDRPIDLVLSGINQGQNLGTNILYSGTVAAAREGVLLGIPSIAFSQAYRDITKVDFAVAARIALDLTRKVLARGLPPGVFLNVNIPPAKWEDIQGYAITRQGDSGFRDKFMHISGHPDNGGVLYRNVGERFAPSSSEDLDLDDRAVKQKKVSITPLHVDTTAHHILESLQDLTGQ